jgi:hypothetical protein
MVDDEILMTLFAVVTTVLILTVVAIALGAAVHYGIL